MPIIGYKVETADLSDKVCKARERLLSVFLISARFSTVVLITPMFAGHSSLLWASVVQCRSQVRG